MGLIGPADVDSLERFTPLRNKRAGLRARGYPCRVIVEVEDLRMLPQRVLGKRVAQALL